VPGESAIQRLRVPDRLKVGPFEVHADVYASRPTREARFWAKR
jgi:hypothetical protein